MPIREIRVFTLAQWHRIQPAVSVVSPVPENAGVSVPQWAPKTIACDLATITTITPIGTPVSRSKYGQSVSIPETPRFGPDGPTLSQLAADIVRQPFSNTIRGLLAEALVARLIGGRLQDPWAWVDIELGLWTVEIKSTSNVQAWSAEPINARRLQFSIAAASAWNPETGEWSDKAMRWADLYVFAHLHASNAEVGQFMSRDNWTFYLVPTDVLDREFPSAKSISLRAVQKASEPVFSEELHTAVHAALARSTPRPGPVWAPLKTAAASYTDRVAAAATPLGVDPITAITLFENLSADA